MEQPSGADLRRAMSTVYYALFHAVAGACADAFPAEVDSGFERDANHLAYRALEHGPLRQACANPNVLRRLHPLIGSLAQILPSIQAKRHAADYSPTSVLTAGEVADDIERCEKAILDFLAAPEPDRRAFVAFVLFRSR